MAAFKKTTDVRSPPHCFKNPVASVTAYRFDKNWRQLLEQIK
jgi:hypothetical protein